MMANQSDDDSDTINKYFNKSVAKTLMMTEHSEELNMLLLALKCTAIKWPLTLSFVLEGFYFILFCLFVHQWGQSIR